MFSNLINYPLPSNFTLSLFSGWSAGLVSIINLSVSLHFVCLKKNHQITTCEEENTITTVLSWPQQMHKLGIQHIFWHYFGQVDLNTDTHKNNNTNTKKKSWNNNYRLFKCIKWPYNVIYWEHEHKINAFILCTCIYLLDIRDFLVSFKPPLSNKTEWMSDEHKTSRIDI